MDKRKPIIIVGAPRSGTKMLRGILASHPDIAVFPSEIDYIWKYGNENFPTDQLTPELATARVRQYIHKQFSALSARHSDARIVEKSVANTLRVSFVHAVFPDAYFIHLIRDGRANVESVRRSWESGASLKYILQKFEGLNWLDAMLFAPDYLRYHRRRLGLFGAAGGVKGPHFDGIKQLLEEKDFLEVCGIQWRVCVESARKSLQEIPPEQVIEIRYEDLVTRPLEVVEAVFSKVDLSFLPECQEHIQNNVHDQNLEKWQQNLAEAELAKLLPHITSELNDLGYST